MNHQSWSKRKFWIIIAAVFLVGAMIASSGASANEQVAPKTRVETKTEIKEVKVTDTESIKRLNNIDRQIFADSAEVVGLQSEALSLAGTAFGQINYMSVAEINAMTSSVQAKTTRIEELTNHLEGLIEQRNQLMSELGIS